MVRTFISRVFAVTCLWYASTAVAMIDIRSSEESRLDFSVLIHQNNLVLENSENVLDTTMLGFGFQVVDIPPHLPIQIGFGVGYAFIDQQTVPGLNNASMGGLYFSLMARGTLFTTGAWSSDAILAYDYVTAEKGGEKQQSRLRWNHFTAEANLNYFLTSYLSISLGGIYGVLNAKLTGSGETNASLALDTDNRFAAFAGVHYHVMDQQKLAMTFQQGYYNRLVVQFQRTFY